MAQDTFRVPEERKAQHQQHRLRLMERELKRIGVTEEQKAQIIGLQNIHREKMEANARNIAAAREKLSILLDEGAPMDTLEAAIQESSRAVGRFPQA